MLLQMVLHYAEEPAAVVDEARRMLAPGGRLVVVDLAGHANTALLAQMGHRSAGFSDAEMLALFGGARLLAACPVDAGGTAASAGQDGALRVRIWQGTAPADIAAVSEAVFAEPAAHRRLRPGPSGRGCFPAVMIVRPGSC